jgi:hypothetical protein
MPLVPYSREYSQSISQPLILILILVLSLGVPVTRASWSGWAKKIRLSGVFTELDILPSNSLRCIAMKPKPNAVFYP